MAIKVKLRKRSISNGRQSLYLDFYPEIINPKTGKLTRRDFLGYYVFDKPKTPFDKIHNKDTLLIAEQIRQKRENELNKPEVYHEFEREQLKNRKMSEYSFIEYFKQLTNKRKDSNYATWISASHYIERFTNGILKFADINERFCKF